MTDYDAFLSRNGEKMQGSAIRKMGVVSAGIPDMISFAPGYPDPAVFAWEAFRAIAADLLSGRDPDAFQYGPTRGYAPPAGGAGFHPVGKGHPRIRRGVAGDHRVAAGHRSRGARAL